MLSFPLTTYSKDALKASIFLGALSRSALILVRRPDSVMYVGIVGRAMNEDVVSDGLPDVRHLSLEDLHEAPQTSLTIALKRILVGPADPSNGFQSSI
jgi:hypothetical protein